MNTSPKPDHDGQGSSTPNDRGHRPAVAAPNALPDPALPAPATAVGPTADDEATVLLERVVQRIFAAGLLLHTAPGDRPPVHAAQPALEQLDNALNDIRATVVSWITRSEHRNDQPTGQLGTAIAHLRVVAGILHRTAASDAARSDGTVWAAINDADHAVRRALLILEESARGRADLERDPPAAPPGTRTEG